MELKQEWKGKTILLITVNAANILGIVDDVSLSRIVLKDPYLINLGSAVPVCSTPVPELFRGLYEYNELSISRVLINDKILPGFYERIEESFRLKASGVEVAKPIIHP